MIIYVFNISLHPKLNRSKGYFTMAEAKLIAMKMKYVFEPMFWIPTGQVCAAMMEPMAPPDAAKLRPRARRFVGKI
jgi:hypothetical protein